MRLVERIIYVIKVVCLRVRVTSRGLLFTCLGFPGKKGSVRYCLPKVYLVCWEIVLIKNPCQGIGGTYSGL